MKSGFKSASLTSRPFSGTMVVCHFFLLFIKLCHTYLIDQPGNVRRQGTRKEDGNHDKDTQYRPNMIINDFFLKMQKAKKLNEFLLRPIWVLTPGCVHA